MAEVKKVGRSKSNQIIFDSYQKAINNRMKAGHDVTRLTSRLNKLVMK